MGGHSAWRKRVERGELAKRYAEAICRHRPHFGRTGKDIDKNSKGNIGKGNPKKMPKVLKDKTIQRLSSTAPVILSLSFLWFLVLLSTIASMSYVLFR
jgi:hypothetical protein